MARALNLTREILVVGAGRPLPKPEVSDQLMPFWTHQEYFHLTGLNDAAGAVVVFDPQDGAAGSPGGGWHSFVPTVTEAERVWEGRSQLPGEPMDDFGPWLRARSTRQTVMLGTPVPDMAFDAARTAEVRLAFQHARRAKDAAEIDTLRRGAAATASGYAAIQPLLRPGIDERTIQIELEAGYFRHGAQKTGYDTIVGIGAQSAVFHGTPSPYRIARDGDFILIDSGAELDRYVTDVTRTYVAGNASGFQRELMAIVRRSLERATSRCRPGAEWKEIHLGAAVDLMEGLVELGLLKGNPTALVEREAHMLFFPHGVGHMVGLGVRDASGMEPGRERDPRPSLKNLRMDLTLRPGYVVTVEPGLYFIPTILNDRSRRERFSDCVAWHRVEPHLQLGGVRFEENLLITDSEPENLTAAIPL